MSKKRVITPNPDSRAARVARTPVVVPPPAETKHEKSKRKAVYMSLLHSPFPAVSDRVEDLYAALEGTQWEADNADIESICAALETSPFAV